MSHPIVSTGAGNRERRLLDGGVRYLSARRCGARVLENLLDPLGLFGDAADSDDDVCAGGGPISLPFPLPLCVGPLAASPGNFSSSQPQNIVLSVLVMSTLMRFEQRAGDGSRPSPDSGHAQAAVVLTLE